MTDHSSFDNQVRRGDEDRWLAARFVADPTRRAELIALYAVNLEFARTAASVSNPLMGEIRLEWWREGLDELAAGKAARAPVMEALRPALDDGRLDRPALERIIDARRLDLDPAPFADEPALVGYLDDTAGALMLAAARLLAPETQASAVQSAGRVWGWAAWLRAKPAVEVAGRRWTPAGWGETAPDEVSRHVDHRIADALKAARGQLSALPVAAFPAVSYAALARRSETGPLAKRARLTWATLRGRV